MDLADQAQRVSKIELEASMSHKRDAGPKPVFVSLCLFCGEAIERVRLEDAANARRWCCAACRDSWEKEHKR